MINTAYASIHCATYKLFPTEIKVLKQSNTKQALTESLSHTCTGSVRHMLIADRRVRKESCLKNIKT